MNEGVFFVVEPVSGPSIFILKNIFLALGASILIFLIFFVFKKIQKKSSKNIPKRKKTSYILPEISEKNFGEKSFLLLQKFVSEKYMPENSFSHTISDIAKYCNNKRILELYNLLEKSLYQKKLFSDIEKTKIHNDLQKIIFESH
ncbi:hypothetical protein HG442_003720 [Candidatus Gracilibacteria bacterium]|nr:hypothetical protein [Candidatus Gracilibacteria bacterium]